MYSFHFLDRAVSSFMGATDWRASSPASPRSCVIATARDRFRTRPSNERQPACPWLNCFWIWGHWDCTLNLVDQLDQVRGGPVKITSSIALSYRR